MTAFDFLQNTRASYDAIADEYATRFRGELAAKPLERALLVAFAELVRDNGGGPLADVGCGTGRVTGFLHGLGADVFGIDLSPGMLAAARRDHPELRFEEGSMLALDLPDGGLGGLLAWYSTIHVPDGQLPGVLAEFFRVLAPAATSCWGSRRVTGCCVARRGSGTTSTSTSAAAIRSGWPDA